MGEPSLTERYRLRLREAMGTCPTCHRPMDDSSLRKTAAAIGDVSFTTLHRFLRGEQVQSGTLDRIAAYLDDEEARRGR